MIIEALVRDTEAAIHENQWMFLIPRVVHSWVCDTIESGTISALSEAH
jgi:hypothetical protein